MDVLKIYVNDRNYSSWNIFETSNLQPVNLEINPAEHKLFSNDVFSVDDAKNIKLIHSSVRSGPVIPGVLIISDNKTYGRQQKNKKDGLKNDGLKNDGLKNDGLKNDGRLLYKCIPDDMRLPPFLVPYEIKNVGFSKVFVNLYVTFSFVEWNGKHPLGVLTQVIGPVDVLDNFYEYQLYCKSLNASIQKFQKDTIIALQDKSSHETFIESICDKFPSIENRTDWHIFTIDPPKSADFDDGFSIKQIDDNIQQLSIYIANVTILMDVLNLWDSFSQRISTIYLPDRKRPMLPTILSDCLCSLQENHNRFAFVMDIFIQDNEIIQIKYSNCMIKVHKNYSYEEKSLLINPNYINLMDTTKKLSKKYKYINNVRNSHELVCYLMILMNYNCATEMIKHKAGIFRSTIIKKDFTVPDNIPEDVSKFIKIWNSSSGQYINGKELDSIQIRHEMLELDAYIHITSPIRRLVDLLNIIKFQQNTGIIQLSENSDKFYNKWLDKLEYINTTMRSIRKVQIDCTLLDLCANNQDIMEKEYDGYLFDKILKNDGLFQFMVFLPELKLSSRITLRYDINNFENKKFKLFLFNDEENFKKKIRLHLV
jgi:exoribonuclease R